MAQLIVYFSRRGENYVSGRIQPLSVGNTEVVARRLQVLTGADLFQLEPVHPYSDNYNQCIESRPRPTSGRMPGPPCGPCRIIWRTMTPSTWAIPTTGEPCPCASSPF